MMLACQHVHNVYIFVSPYGYLTLYSFMFRYLFFCRIFFNKTNSSINCFYQIIYCIILYVQSHNCIRNIFCRSFLYESWVSIKLISSSNSLLEPFWKGIIVEIQKVEGENCDTAYM